MEKNTIILTEQTEKEFAELKRQKDEMGENKRYLFLSVYETDDNEIRSFEFITGRRVMYETLIDLIVDTEFGVLDCHKSQIIVDIVTIDQAVSVYEFMEAMEDKFPDIDFLISDYIDKEEVE